MGPGLLFVRAVAFRPLRPVDRVVFEPVPGPLVVSRSPCVQQCTLSPLLGASSNEASLQAWCDPPVLLSFARRLSWLESLLETAKAYYLRKPAFEVWLLLFDLLFFRAVRAPRRLAGLKLAALAACG